MTLRVALAPAALAAALLAPPDAHAQLFRAYLSSKGADSNPCTVAAPCRLLPAALAAVAHGGEVWMLDSANYNTAPVPVTKSVSILAIPSAIGSLVSVGQSALAIATPGVKVTLRNLSFAPIAGNAGSRGVAMSAGTALTIERCTFAEMGYAGVEVTAPAQVRILESTFRDNGSFGVWVGAGSRTTIASSSMTGHATAGIFALMDVESVTTLNVVDSVMAANTDGFRMVSTHPAAQGRGSLARSAVVGSAFVGVGVQSNAGGSVQVSLAGSHLAGNAYHTAVLNAGARIWASDNTIVEGSYGLYTVGTGQVESTGDNALRFNRPDIDGNVALVPRR